MKTRNALNGGIALSLLLLFFSSAGIHAQKTNELAVHPPMGWNGFNAFADKIDDATVRSIADAMVRSGLRDKGYVYINLDESWEGGRDSFGNIKPNSKFPDMKSLGDYIHSRGLRFGIYTSPGEKTCGGNVGSLGHEVQDAKTFASWGVDYLKYDLCSYRQVIYKQAGGDIDKQMALLTEVFAKMRRAIDQAGRPMVYSLSPGMGGMWMVGPAAGANLWRTTADIEPVYERIALIGFGQAGLSHFAGPGHWNDPDMLEVGNGKLSFDESKTHMSLWAILAAPLIAGNDLTHMSAETLSILNNEEVIAIDQDPLGIQGDRVKETGPLEIWSKPLAGNAKAVGLFNRSISPMKMTLKLRDVGLQSAHIRDLWLHKDLGEIKDEYTVVVPRYGVVLLRLSN